MMQNRQTVAGIIKFLISRNELQAHVLALSWEEHEECLLKGGSQSKSRQIVMFGLKFGKTDSS